MKLHLSPHRTAVLQALLVSLLWSTSWVLIKFNIQDIPPLTFAGIRYVLGTIFLFVFVAYRRKGLQAIRSLTSPQWKRLAFYGLIYYMIAQGSQYIGLTYLPATTVNLILSFASMITAVLGIFLLKEIPTPVQWSGVALSLGGAALYFLPVQLPAGTWIGLGAALVSMLGNAWGGLIGREINKRGDVPAEIVTVVSMGIGSVVMLFTGLFTEPFPHLTLTAWLAILWMAAVNTAFCFTLWNMTMRHLTAVESSIIGNTMMIYIPILAVIFLQESLNLKEVSGLALAAAGVLLVQMRNNRK